MILINIAIRIPSVQNFIVQKAVGILEKQTGAKVELAHIHISFPKAIVVEGLYVEDLKSDTLAYIGRLKVNAGLMGLLRKNIHIQDIDLENTTVKLKRNEADSSFNFGFIADSLSSGEADTAKPEKQSEPWKITLDDLQLSDIRFLMIDSLSGMNVRTRVGELSIEMNKLDMETPSFDVNEISLVQSDIHLDQYGLPDTTSQDTSGGLPGININRIKIEQVNFSFADAYSKFQIMTRTGEIRIDFDKLSLAEQLVRINELSMQGTSSEISMFSPEPGNSTPTDSITSEGEPSQPWDIAVNEINLGALAFKMDNTAATEQQDRFDPSHINISNLDMEAEEVIYKGNDIAIHLQQLNLQEKHGFTLEELSGKLTLSDTSAKAESLLFQTAGTKIELTAKAGFTSLGEITEFPDKTSLTTNLEVDRLNTTDIEYFVPGIFDSVPVNLKETETLTLKADVKGRLNDFTINNFELNLLDSTALHFKGEVSGLPETENLMLDFATLQLMTSRGNLNRLVTDSLLPQSIAFPSSLRINSDISGSMDDIHVDAGIRSSFGMIGIEGNLKNMTGDKPVWDIKSGINNFALGKLMKDTTTFGMITLQIEGSGTGFDPFEMESEVTMTVPSFVFNQYEYNNVNLVAGASRGKFDLLAGIDDQNLDLKLDGSFTYDTLNPAINLKADLKGVNLQALGFSDADIRSKGKLIARLNGNSVSNLNGEIQTREVLIIKEGELYPVDSLIFVSFNDPDSTRINIQSDILSAKYQGTLKVDKLSSALTGYFNRYFTFSTDSNNIATDAGFDFRVGIHSSALLTEVLVPGLKKLDPGYMEGTFDAAEAKFEIQGNLPLVEYNGNRLKGFNLTVTGDSEKLNAGLSIDQVNISSFFVTGIELNSEVSGNTINATFSIPETDVQAAYNIPFSLRQEDTLYLLSFQGENVVLNSKPWEFTNRDEIRLSDLASGNYRIGLKSGDETIGFTGRETDFKANLENFRLANIGNLLNTKNDVSLINGAVTGDFNIREKQEGESLSASFKISDLAIFDNRVGQVQVNLESPAGDNLTGKLIVSGENEFSLLLNKIALDSTQSLDVVLAIDRFQMRTLNGFLPDTSDNLYGWLGGRIELGNTMLDPEINGEINFNEVNTRLNSYGTYVEINDQKINIKKNKLIFPQFTIKDQSGGSLKLDGQVNLKELPEYQLDLKMNADHFTAIDKKGKQDAPFRGKFVFGTNTRVQGNSDDLKVDASFTINDATDFSVNLLESSPTATSYKGIVEFVDKDRSLNPILIDSTDDQVSFMQQNITVAANIEIQNKAKLEMLVDPRAGDRLWVQGSANLTFNLDKTGLPTLSGRYNLNDGGYKLTLFGLTQREFNLRDGSYILWTGQPMEARLNIDAAYEVKTSAYNLIIDQTNNVSGNDMKQYRQKLPFTVVLMIRGEIETPEINFSISLPPDKRGIYNGVVQSKLNQLETPGNESELNKQVLALLAFKQFMPQNPLEMGGESGGLSSTARSSVSRLLSNQLNNFSDKYIKGVRVSFDVESYEQYGEEGGVEERTELGIGVSKSFFNNRLEVSVGSNVELESEKYRRENSFNDIAEDIEVEYKLTENGVYRAKAFRYNEYEQFEGDIIQSGLSLIFNRDFNRFRYIFKDADSTKRDRKEESEQQDE
ncbi:MAG: translocation/assembly module TamB [Bacteroidales bacterium]|nr:translocation/assembly module TamB [Bacteroidales bacterium]